VGDDYSFGDWEKFYEFNGNNLARVPARWAWATAAWWCHILHG
jgi:hypothetical protein